MTEWANPNEKQIRNAVQGLNVKQNAQEESEREKEIQSLLDSQEVEEMSDLTNEEKNIRDIGRSQRI